MEIYGFIAMLFVGGALGLMGGGGAILTVPIMVYLFHKPAVLATSYSLFIVGVSSLFGVWQYHQKKLVDYRTAVTFAIPSFFGTYLARRTLMPRLPEVIGHLGTSPFTKDQLIMTVFATVMLGASVSMIRGGKEAMKPQPVLRNHMLIGILGLIVGFVAGFVGAGGGFLIIPALVVLAGMPMQSAVGTSLLIICANSLFGFGGDVFAKNQMDWEFLAAVTGISLVGIFVGSYTARFISASTLKPAFGWFVLLMGSYIMFMQMYG